MKYILGEFVGALFALVVIPCTMMFFLVALGAAETGGW